MKKIIILCFGLFCCACVNASVRIYEGTIGLAKVEFQVQFADYLIDSAIYAYDKYKAPILLNADTNNGGVTFHEYDEKGKHIATFQFTHLATSYDDEDSTGQFINLKTNQTSNVILKLKYDLVDSGDFIEDIEVFQLDSLPDIYFKTVIPRYSVDLYVARVNLYNKKTAELVQSIDFGNSQEVGFFGANSIGIGDFNFDGVSDFSVVEHYLRRDIAERYYFYDSNNKKYQALALRGTSFMFDDNAKTAISSTVLHNGAMMFHEKYQWNDHQFVLIEEYYSFYDEINDDYIKAENDERPDFLYIDEVPHFALYEGTIGNAKIKLQAHFKKSGRIDVIYAYDHYGIPIVLQSTTISDDPVFHEFDGQNKHTATLMFTDFSRENKTISGKFLNEVTNSYSDISLNLIRSYTTRDDYRHAPNDIFQRESTKDVYFTTRVGNWHSDNEKYPTIYHIDIYSKKTGEKLGEGVDMRDGYDNRFMVFDNVKINNTTVVGKSHSVDGINMPDFTVASSLAEYTRIADGSYTKREIKSSKGMRYSFYSKVNEDYVLKSEECGTYESKNGVYTAVDDEVDCRKIGF